ncbi:AMIN-like domain-containing (lipo)protein [Rhodococcoides corynebacterioides]|uniref:AMIN-like domain-containing (lipo)protein n=1 Tax=Rhodococcoides corynebacterioides TaxID=53972 RepID=UPI001C9AB786|nr:hypothetical protein [Rhodococcus corynebacterioides]MBY6364347.1 hypothetical protein [Rhodococcus corynebacterioides]
MQTLRKLRDIRSPFGEVRTVTGHAIVAFTAFAVVMSLSACGTGTQVGGPVDSALDPVTRDCSVTDAWSGTVTVGDGKLPPGPVLAPPDTDDLPGQAIVGDVALQEVALSPGSDDQSALRIGYEFIGDGQIGWSARYTSLPLRHANSEPVPVAGTCLLQVDFTGFPTTSESDVPPYQSRLTTTESNDVVEVVTFGPTTGDAVTQSFIGFRSVEPVVRIGQSGEGSSLEIVTSSEN